MGELTEQSGPSLLTQTRAHDHTGTGRDRMANDTRGQTSLYRYYDSHGVLIYIGITGRGMARNAEHNADKDWWPYVASQSVEHFETRNEALAQERRLIGKHLPPFNTQHNPHHARMRAAYMSLVDAVSDKLEDPVRRRELRNRYPLTVLSEPFPGHRVTLIGSPDSAGAIVGEMQTPPESQSVLVSTPQVKRAGHVVDLRYRGGVLLVGVAGKHIPAVVTHGKAMLKVVQNVKPATFYVRSVFLNDPHDIEGAA